MMPSRAGLFFNFAFATTLAAQPVPPSVLSRTMEAAQAFRDKAPAAISRETLHQRSFAIPPHAHIAIGAAAADPLRPRFFLHEVVSEYSIATLKGTSPTQLLEFRELVEKDGAPVNTPEKARRALQQDVRTGEERLRKHILEELTALGLADVATDYGLILLAFTREGLTGLEVVSGGEGFVGAEEAVAFDFRQISGGALEFRGKKVARLPMQGTLWVRRSDGVPLRISCWTEHPDGKHILRDQAMIDYGPTALGFVAPATVVHRHFVDGQALTENLYSYEPFHLFTTDTRIEYSTPKK
jgi:hypothetical protein